MPNNENIQKMNNQKEITNVVEWLVQSGFLTDRTIQEKDIRLANAERLQHLYHNTRLLLKHYRDIIWILESFPDEIADEMQEPIKDLDLIIERLSHEIDSESTKYLDRLKSINKSRNLVELIHRAMMTLKSKPNDGERMYNVIYYTYFYRENLSTLDLLNKLKEVDKYNTAMSERTYYYVRNKAIRILSLCLWSSPNKELDSWINLTIMLKNMNDAKS